MTDSPSIPVTAFMAAVEVAGATASMAAIADLAEPFDPQLAAYLRLKKLSTERKTTDSMIEGYATTLLLRNVIGETDRDVIAAVVSELNFENDPRRIGTVAKVVGARLRKPEHVREAKALAEVLKSRPAFMTRLREIHARYSRSHKMGAYTQEMGVDCKRVAD